MRNSYHLHTCMSGPQGVWCSRVSFINCNCVCSLDMMQAPSAGDDEVAKREALAEALSNFCTVVRQGQPRRSDEQELLTASGKLSMQHLLPVYNVREAPSPSSSTPACVAPLFPRAEKPCPATSRSC